MVLLIGIAPVTAMIPVLAFYLTYVICFKNLNGWRVLPLLYVIGSFGFMGNTGNSHPIVLLLPKSSFNTYNSETPAIGT